MTTDPSPTWRPDRKPSPLSGARPQTVRSMALGLRLRRLRENADLTAKDAAAKTQISASTVSRMEKGTVPYTTSNVEKLLSLYGAEPEIRGGLIEMAKHAHEPGWWKPYSNAVPEFMHFRLSLEQEAYRISTYDTQFVPGLLQVADYARAVIESGPAHLSKSVVDGKVTSRMERQKVFERAGLEVIRIVIDEAALQRAWGGPDVMREQIRHIRRVIEDRRNVMIRVAQFNPPATVHCGPLTTFELEDPQFPHIVYLEQRHGASYVDEKAAVEEYRKSYEALFLSSLSSDKTLAILDRYEQMYS